MSHSSSIPCLAILTTDQIQDWMDGNLAGRGEHHLRRLAGFWQDVENGRRVIWAAWGNPDANGTRPLLGQVTVQEDSHYPPFKKHRIYEIVDLWVHPASRGQGLGRRLLHACIDHARERQCAFIGLGVGITRDFGPAQRLYAQEGFLPDGTGLWVQGRQPDEGETITLENGVLMMWVKPL